ncbi:3-oxoacyl-ACP reductase family protein [Methyloceanibacter sp.]|uniref:3-oxoacyl-ACP reductase family protein n=1 Tax=Methyloceanibacter sp. TaxID=1965321 RepID=UPI002081EA80|nr:3-oxoacyl-ACP reductase family protein [Methyloceanibacter sp.]GFO82415.1 MAG: oxidoreductase [Methyloceanibacter sp.]HML92851.1 3-oxoacyl-ACP reductase family protein [Methyloceanibacter sp.]
MSKTLEGKVALVTGGSRGIGAAIARALAKDGADVAISYAASRDAANAVVEAMRALGVRAKAFQADQGKPDEASGLIAAVISHFGRIDILVNNAGVFVLGQVHERANDLAEFDRMFDVNVRGVAAAVRAAAPSMSEGGRIISIGSVVGESTPFAGAADYSATKAALLGLTRGWARDLGPRGITVNAVQPGPIDTDMNPDRNGEFSDAQKGFTALGRYGTADEVAAAVSFLASPGASYITGTALTVDGGFNA